MPPLARFTHTGHNIGLETEERWLAGKVAGLIPRVHAEQLTATRSGNDIRVRANDSDRTRLQTSSFSSHASVSTLSRNAPRAAVVFFGSDSRPSYLNGAEVARDGSGMALAAGALLFLPRRKFPLLAAGLAGLGVCVLGWSEEKLLDARQRGEGGHAEEERQLAQHLPERPLCTNHQHDDPDQ